MHIYINAIRTQNADLFMYTPLKKFYIISYGKMPWTFNLIYRVEPPLYGKKHQGTLASRQAGLETYSDEWWMVCWECWISAGCSREYPWLLAISSRAAVSRASVPNGDKVQGDF